MSIRLATALTLAVVLGVPAFAGRGGEPPSARATAIALGDAFAEVAAEVVPTTVYLEADRGPEVAGGLQQLMRDYALPAPADDGPTEITTSGSGVIVDPTGLVLTNHHVVSGARALRVVLVDKREFPATVVGSDPRTDIAVVRIDGAGPFPTAPLGDSDTLRVGHWVLTVGHPFDFPFTVTAGIVSARGRRNLIREEIQDYIQTDAAVNPGSSGGPLFNLEGEVVGLNTAIFTPDGGAAQHAGIAFAIPSNMAARIARELIDTGRVARSAIGVATRDAPASGDDARPGAEVTRVTPGGPAEQAGLRRGDVVLAVDGEAIGSSEDLRGLVLSREVGATLQVTIRRGTRTFDGDLVTTDEGRLGSADLAVPLDALQWGGMTLALPTADRAARFGAVLPSADAPGLLVLAVDENGPGASAGLLPGDLLLEVQRETIDGIDRFRELVTGRKTVLVRFWRGGGASYAAVAGLE